MQRDVPTGTSSFEAGTQKCLPPKMQKGRGGSVSRRDHNQATVPRTHLTWARKSEKTTKPIPSHSSGEGLGESRFS